MKPTKIISITKRAIEPTYDILNLADNKYKNEGNFVLDGIIVHNSIPDVIKNRDDKSGKWKDELRTLSEDMFNILEDTHGKIVYQEQLANIWQIVGGFTATEAQEARKAVAKKWVEKLKPIKQKWLIGASTKLGPEKAQIWWDDMESFGRYAFNKSHSVAYSLVAYRCLYLKTYYPAEWWATVMSRCNRKHLTRFMEVARSENVQFGIFDPNFLTGNFVVLKNTKGAEYVSPGLLGVKGIKAKAEHFAGTGNFTNIDEFIEAKGKHKVTFERLIKLGAFTKFEGHENINATWTWYLYKYTKLPKLNKEINETLLKTQWSQEAIDEEIERQAKEFKILYPKRKIPSKILNWKPKPNVTRENVMALIKNDFTLKELLEFEKEYLGYYLRSPLEMYKLNGLTIANAKKTYKNSTDTKATLYVECVIQNAYIGQTKEKKQPFARFTCTDGKATMNIFCWNNELYDLVERWHKSETSIDLTKYVTDAMSSGRKNEDINIELSTITNNYLKFVTGKGVKFSLVYNEERSTYSVARAFDKHKGTQIKFLELKEPNELQSA